MSRVEADEREAGEVFGGSWVNRKRRRDRGRDESGVARGASFSSSREMGESGGRTMGDWAGNDGLGGGGKGRRGRRGLVTAGERGGSRVAFHFMAAANRLCEKTVG